MPDLIRHFFFALTSLMLGLWQSQSPTLIASVIEQTSLFCDTRLIRFHVEQFVLPHLMRHLLF